MARHPHHLPREHYRGRFTHFLTACTYERREAFADQQLCEAATEQLMRACRQHGFEDIAHTLMKDHVHVMVRGLKEESDFIEWLHLWRQLSGYWWRRRTGMWLWQEGYWDYTLRDEESVPGIASYIVWNPVVAGYVSRPEDYPYTGSERCSIAELAKIASVKPRFGDI